MKLSFRGGFSRCSARNLYSASLLSSEIQYAQRILTKATAFVPEKKKSSGMSTSMESVGDYIAKVRTKVLSLWESVREFEKSEIVVESGWRDGIRDCVAVFYTKEMMFIKTGVVRKQKTYKLIRIDEGQALREIAD